MCATHTPTSADGLGSGATVSLSRQTGKPVSRELAGLRLRDDEEAAYHCDEHDHVVKGDLKGTLYVGAGLAVVGLITVFWALLPGLVISLAGLSTAAGAALIGNQRAQYARRNKLPLPLVPQLATVTVVERLQGRVSVSRAAGYTTSRPPTVHGEIRVGMTLGRRGRDRLALYRTRYRLPESEPVEFSAGFAVISGEAGLRFTSRSANAPELPQRAVWCLSGQVAGHPLFGAVPQQPAREWNFTLGYDVLPVRVPDAIPLWIVPSLVPGADRRELEIDVHWDPLDVAGRQLALERFDVIELRFPSEWGNVDGPPIPAATVSPPGSPGVIQWRHLSPEDDATNRQPGRRSPSLTLTARFEKPITSDSTLSGRLQATFSGTLSGLTGFGFYLPGGAQRTDVPVIKPRTEVSVDFDISLGTIRYQDRRTVPAEDSREDRGRIAVSHFPGVIPDYRTVIGVSNALSQDGYYVKSAIEHPPRMSRRRMEVLNRVWDITGRWYEGVFPIDFHIELRGEEENAEGILASAGTTMAKVSVNGEYANLAMRGKIEQKWDELHHILTRIFTDMGGRLPPAAYQQERQAIEATIVQDDDAASVRDALLVRRADLEQDRREVRRARFRSDSPISETEYKEMMRAIEQELEEIERKLADL